MTDGSVGEPRTVQVDGRTVRVQEAGDPQGPPVVLLHGIGRSLEDWDLPMPWLARDHRVIALDLPGFGWSDPWPGPNALDAMADGVARTLEVAGVTRPAAVVGNSLGGAVALHLLGRHPQAVDRLVLVDSAGFGSEVTWLLRLLTVPVVGWLASRRSTRFAARLVERAIFADRTAITADRLDRALLIANGPAGRFQHRVARELGTPILGVRPQWRERMLAAVTEHRRPVLLIWGSKDRVLPPHHLDAARAAFPDAASLLVDGVGHMPQLERPQWFATQVAAFLRDDPVEASESAA